jgi:uncharacterized repeat protein (TIGR02543 family)
MRISVKIVYALMLLTAFLLIACTDNLPEDAGPVDTSPSTCRVSFSSQFNNTESATKMPGFTSKTVDYGSAIGTLPSDPEFSGYKFGGWYTQKGGFGINITENTKIYEDTIVYAYWYNYQVIFESEGEPYASRGVTLPSQTVSSLPSPPTRTGYTFAGWYKSPGGTGDSFIFNTPVNADITVYAKWSTNPVYSVVYDSEGGSAVGTQYVTPPATNVGALPTAPARLFYEFDGWYPARNGGGTEFTASSTVDGTTTQDGVITVYAKWNSTPGYTVKYNSYGGTPVDAQYVIQPATNVGALPADPTKRCYTFDRWYTQPEGEGDLFAKTSTVDDTTTVDGVLTVYAKWIWSPPATPGTFAIGDPGPSCVGKVFYVTDGGLHGLEMAPPYWYVSVDPESILDPSASWINGVPEDDGYGNSIDKTQTTLNGNTSTAVGTGLANSNAIITQVEEAGGTATPYAAKICRDYRGGGFDNWFLPSRDELALLYAQKDVTRSGGFTSENAYGGYWSSSEFSAGNAWSQYFTPASGQQQGTSKGYGRLVRPIRAF